MRLFLSLALLASLVYGQSTRVMGSVLALNGEPVRKATVRLQGQPPANYAASTDNDGKFAFDAVVPGRYTLSAEKAGFVTQRYGARSNTAAGTPLILTAGQELKDLSIQMTPQGIISGHVTDLDGDVTPGVFVYLQRYTYVKGHRQLSSVASNQTNDKGDFRIANLTPGRYYAYARDGRAAASYQEVNILTYYPNALDPAGASSLDLPSGGEMQGVNIQLRRGRVYAIRGKTLDPSGGTSPGGFQVELSSNDTSTGASTRSRVQVRAADGGFEFSNLASGRYVLRAVPGLMREASGQAVQSSYTGRLDVTIANANADAVVLPLARGSDIDGTVKLEDGDLKKLVVPATASAAVPGSTTTIAALSLDVIRADLGLLSGGTAGRIAIALWESDALTSLPVQTVKEDGTFLFQGVAASTYLLNVTGLPDGTYVKLVKFGGQDVTRSPIELRGAGSLAIVLSSKAGGVSGSVHNAKGEPLGGYLVSVWPKTPESGTPTGGVRTATTDQNGTFKFPSLAPGDYYAAAWDDLETGLAQSAEFLSHFNAGASAVRVVEKGQASLDVKLIPRETVAAEIAKLP